MLAAIQGKIEALGTDFAIVKVGGMSFQVFVPTSTLSKMGRRGEEIKLHTHLHLREDNIALYGFASPEELALFKSLIGVSGIGPKLALSLLSAMNAGQLTQAISTGNIARLTQVPGIGKKTASRLVLELKGKLVGGEGEVIPFLAEGENAEAVAALTSLGYSVAEAAKALSALPVGKELSLEEKVRLALQGIGKT